MGRARFASGGEVEALVEFQTTRWFGDNFAPTARRSSSTASSVFLPMTCRPMWRPAPCSAPPICAPPAGLTMPAAIVVGEEDYATPVAMAEAMNRGIKGSTLTVLKGARHLTPLEAPDAIAEELIVLLKRAKDRVEKP